jgi:hypothetical protein
VEGNAFGTRRLGLELHAISQRHGRIDRELPALVNMEGEEAMAELGTKPQLHCRLEVPQC